MTETVEYERATIAGEEVLVVRGEIDLANADEFRHRIECFVDEGRTASLVDLSGVSFIDSSGIAALAAARGHAEEAGTGFVLVAPSRSVRMVLELTGLWPHFTVRLDAASD
jgi:anti-sigma B factor antagonist